MKCVAPCTDEMFVVAWERASCLAQAAQLAGYTGKGAAKVASNRATRLRAMGVPLRQFKRGGALGHVEKLKWLAKRAAEAARAGGDA